MKITRWSFENLHVPMIQDDDGKLWCTTKTLAEVLGITEDAIRVTAKRNADKLPGICVTDSYANFIKINKTELGIKYLRKDMKIWSESEMIRIALWSRSETADVFTEKLVDFVRTNAKKGYVSIEVHNKLVMDLGRMAVEVEALKRVINPDKQIKLRLVQ